MKKNNPACNAYGVAIAGRQKGISIVEVIVGISVIAIIFGSFLELARYNLKIQEMSNKKIQAMNVAIEAIEAVRSVRDESWDNISALSAGTNYYPDISGNKWILNSANPGPVNTLYSRRVVFETVYRDVNDDISASGTEDTETRKVTAYVEWTDRGKTSQIDLSTYITNWR